MPEELVEVSMFHVLKHHDQRVTLHADSIESDDVFMLKVGQELSLTVEILPGIFAGLFKCLHTHTHIHIVAWLLVSPQMKIQTKKHYTPIVAYLGYCTIYLPLALLRQQPQQHGL